MKNIFTETTSNSLFAQILPNNFAIFQDEDVIMELADIATKQHREQVMQDRENMSKFLNNKYNKRRLK